MTIALPTMATTSMATNTADHVILCHTEMLCDGSGSGYTQSCSRSLATVRLDMDRSVDFSASPSMASSAVELNCSSSFGCRPNSADRTMAVQLYSANSSMRSSIARRLRGRGKQKKKKN